MNIAKDVINSDPTLYITNSTFIHNWAKSSGGGAICRFIPTAPWKDSVSVLRNCKFEQNSVQTRDKSASNYGGAVFVSTASVVSFCHNINNLRLDIIACDFTQNRANFGGAVGMKCGDLNINNSKIAFNRAFISGGGVFANVSNLALHSNSFNGNIATINGGALSIVDKGLILSVFLFIVWFCLIIS